MNTLRSSVPLKPTSPRRCPHTVTRVARASHGRQPSAIIGGLVPDQTRAGCAANMGRPHELKDLSLPDIGDVARCIACRRCGAGARRSTTATTATVAAATPGTTDHDRDDGGEPSRPQVAAGGGDLARRRQARFHPEIHRRRRAAARRRPGAAEPPRRGGGAERDGVAVAHRGVAYRDRHRLDCGPQRHPVEHLPGDRRADLRRASAASRRRSAAIARTRSGLRRSRRHCRCGCSCANRARKSSPRRGRAATAPTSRSTTRWCSRPQPIRVTDYTVPFGAFGGIGAQGFSLSRRTSRPIRRSSRRSRRPATSRSARCWRRRRRSRRSLLIGADRDLRTNAATLDHQVRDPGGGARHHQ